MSGAVSRRSYAHAAAFERAGGFGVKLDARMLKTPVGLEFVTPKRALAEACAAEWSAQGEHIVPARMPLTQLAFSALDHTPLRRADLRARIAKYGETDLCCHRAEAPAALAAHQAAAWDPILAWADEALGIKLQAVVGIIAAPAPPEAVARLCTNAAALDDFRLTALAHATDLAGSALIGFALLHGQLGAERAFAAAALDDLWSLKHWGEDGEACARLECTRTEFQSLERFVAALEAP